MSIENIKKLFDAKVSFDIPRWGSFDRSFVGELLYHIDELEKKMSCPVCNTELEESQEGPLPN